VGPKPSFFYEECCSLITYSEAFDPDRYLGDDLSCLESAAQSDAMMRDHWTFGAGYVDLVTPVDSFRLLIRPLPAVVFVLECISQRGKCGWRYLAFYGASRYALSPMNRSVLTTGKAKAEERRSHSGCTLSRGTRMWPPYCQAVRVQCADDHVNPVISCVAVHCTRWSVGGPVVSRHFSIPLCTRILFHHKKKIHLFLCDLHYVRPQAACSRV